MEETTVTIDMGKDDLQLTTTSVLEYLRIYPPFDEERNTAFYIGVQMLYDILKSTF